MSDTLEAPKRNYKAGPGRPKGSQNKATKEIRALAADYGPAAVRRLAVLGGIIPRSKLKANEAPAKSEATQAVCLGMLLNRAYGFPSQPLQHSADESFETLLDRLERRRQGAIEPPKPRLIEVATDGSYEVVEPASDEAAPDGP